MPHDAWSLKGRIVASSRAFPGKPGQPAAGGAAVARLLRTVEPAEIRAAVGEPHQLAAETPYRWERGTKLHGVRTSWWGRDGTPAPGALDPASVRVRVAGTGRELARDREYLIDATWGALGLPASAAACAVEVDYRYSLRRIDSIVSDVDGRLRLLRGRSELTVPRPPEPPAGETLVGNVYIPYFGGRERFHYLPADVADEVVSAPQLDKLPRVAAKLRAGVPVTVVCWGDSVTVGGDASSGHTAYPAVLARLLRAAYPAGAVDVVPVAVDGSSTSDWLAGAGDARIERVLAASPDLVTVEFVNDAHLPASRWQANYDEIAARIAAADADLMLTTPHFTMPDWMGDAAIDGVDRRPYVAFLRRYAAATSTALADVSARWERLHRTGLPYVTLLNNGINHPDDRGHALAATEIAAVLFAAPPADTA